MRQQAGWPRLHPSRTNLVPPLPTCPHNRCEAAGQLLILAAQLGKGAVLKPLLAFGASLEAVDEHGHQGPALLHAASAGNVNIVRALLEASGSAEWGLLAKALASGQGGAGGLCGSMACCPAGGLDDVFVAALRC